MGLYDRGYYREESGLDLRPDWNQRSAVSILIIVNVAVFIANMLFGSPTVGNQGKVNEALMLWPKVKAFVKEKGREPNVSSPDPLEQRMAAAVLHIKKLRQARGK